MHGAIPIYLALTIPIGTFSVFVVSRRRVVHTWRSKAIDPEHPIYPLPNALDLVDVRRVEAHDAPGGEAGLGVTPQSSPGLVHRKRMLNADEVRTLLRLVRGWVAAWGLPLDQRLQDAYIETLRAVGYPSDFVSGVRTVSGVVEGLQPVVTPWGSGDQLDLAGFPPALRHLAERVRREFPFIGRVRNVSILYSPTGEFFRPPGAPLRWCGHDYVIIPLAASPDERRVVTLSPLMRSSNSDPHAVVRDSWTGHDIDVLMEPGAALRVYGRARFQWGWGMRPSPNWFGRFQNPVAAQPDEVAGNSTLARAPSVPATTNTSSSVLARLVAWALRRPGGVGGEVAAVQLRRGADGEEGAPMRDAAMLVLQFEGPLSLEETRRSPRIPERYAFGCPPTTSDFESWCESMPDERDVWEKGLWWFLENWDKILIN